MPLRLGMRSLVCVLELCRHSLPSGGSCSRLQGSIPGSNNGVEGGKAQRGHASGKAGKPRVVCTNPTPPLAIPEVLGLIQPRLECCAVNSLIWHQSGTSSALSSHQVPVLALKGLKCYECCPSSRLGEVGISSPGCFLSPWGLQEPQGSSGAG